MTRNTPVASKDVVTLSTFGMQERWKFDKDGVKRFIDSQVANIRIMKKSFDDAARGIGREPPQIVLSALMIPHWKSGENYTGQNYNSEDYQKIKAEYFDYLAEKCKTEGITIQDFYEEAATSDEKDYLHQLEALGSTADLIKNRAIINNQGKRHLQIDTNTIIVDRKAFYNATIGSNIQKDGMNASYYDESGLYVSPHNKVVYTCEDSKFAGDLARQHDGYVAESKDLLERKTPGSNQIYSVGFSKAAMDSGLVSYNRKYYPQWNNLWGCYSVDCEHPIFEMTKHIVTAINMSWSQGDGKVDYCAALKSIKVSVQSESNEATTLDFPSFSYLIKKYTNPKLPENDREKLLAISDTNYDEVAVTSFVNHVIQSKNISLFGPLLRTIPNTERGNQLLKELFAVFKNDLNFQNIIKNPNINDKVTPEDLEVIAKFIPEGTFVNEKARLIQYSQQLLVTRNEQLQSSMDLIKNEICDKVKAKLDTLQEPYIVSDTDKAAVSAVIDSLITENCLQDLTINGVKEVALNVAINKLLGDKLKQHPAIAAILKDQDQWVQDKIKNKIYSAPANEKFNRAEIDKMVTRIISDVGFIRAEGTREKFFENPEVKKYINILNKLASQRPIDITREVQIENMANALMNAVSAFSKTAAVPPNMGDYLKGYYDELQKQNPKLSNYSELIIDRSNNISKDTSIKVTVDTKQRLESILNKAQLEAHTPEATNHKTSPVV
ncbi:hypothetical protein Lsai_0927 [Legionella sainthelensi]|uniref:Uncharacterized protein n=1 Tax=Legionella sainthelensi TaxID=28087 RepID=A0A0W0YN52_9GAMM|nr:hypothetical protein [Legionella sainthelensi]KTD58320.1 hypothetical protein Lsai_0927 [Legionella sainthelensi]VEH27182.1 Uncharacterised protein [Legionella sainthelensi]